MLESLSRFAPRRCRCIAHVERRIQAMKNATWAVVVLGIVALALVAGVVQGQQAPSGEYKIGVLEPLTGNLAVQGKLHVEGYEIMRDLINTRFGGVMGKKLVFAVGDAVDPTAAASEATRLAAREGVKIITGTFSSTLCGAASEAAARQNVIYWETSCVDPRMTRRNLKNVFRTEIDGTGFGWYNVEVKAVVHAGATGYGTPGFGKAFGNDANGPFALLEPGPGFIIEKLRPEGQAVERAFREAVKAKTGSDVLAGGHQLAAGGLWV